jgi:hypothetical protein
MGDLIANDLRSVLPNQLHLREKTRLEASSVSSTRQDFPFRVTGSHCGSEINASVSSVPTAVGAREVAPDAAPFLFSPTGQLPQSIDIAFQI